MSVIMKDGADYYGTADIPKKYMAVEYSNGTTYPQVVTPGRNGVNGGALRLRFRYNAGSDPCWVGTAISGNYRVLHFGFGLRITGSISAGGDRFFWLYDTNTTQIEIGITNTRLLFVSRNGTVLGTAATGAIPDGSWAHIAVNVTIGDATGDPGTYGAVEVFVNSASVLALTNVDTKNTANAQANYFFFYPVPAVNSAYGNPGNGPPFDFDDLWFDDTDQHGDCYIETGRPTADGAQNDFTAVGAVAHYDCVDDAASDGDTTYLNSATLNARELFQFENVTATAAVKSVAVNVIGRTVEGGARAVKGLTRQGGVVYESTTERFLSSSYQSRQLMMQLNPATGLPWTPAEINDAATEFGFEIST